MAWSSVGSLGTANSTSPNQSSLVLTTSATLEAGNVGVVIIAVDNHSSTDGDEGAVTGVVDSAGNTWSKAGEYTNGQGTSQDGATCSVWYCKAATQLPSGGTITISFGNAPSRDAAAATAWELSVAAGSTISVAATNTQAVDGGDAASLDAVTTNAEHLRVRGCAVEARGVGLPTATAGWTLFTASAADSGAANTSMTAFGEFHISTGTGDASDPTLGGVVRDNASVYAALLETVTVTGFPEVWAQYRRRRN